MGEIRVQNLTKQYKDVKALDDVSLKFKFGKIYGLLGRNGAGKSTLIKLITNRIFADKGEILVNEIASSDNQKTRKFLFCMSEANYYPNLKVTALFKWTKEFYADFDMEKALELSEKFEVNIKKKFNALSTGYKNIVKLIIALSLNCEYTIFDEPVVGLDVNHRELFYKSLLEKYEKNECTLILATHLIEEIANLIEHVVLIDEGKILLDDNIENVLALGYSIAGRADEIDEYIKGKNVLDIEIIAGMKIAYILGDVVYDNEYDNMTISQLNLQKLFLKLTERNKKL